MATVSLSSGVRSALSSLNSTKTDAQQAQYRLATGKKVNSAVDNPVNFFTASGLNSRAGQLTDLLDGISNGVQTIQAASKGLDSITSLVKSLQSTVKQAQNDAAANRPKIVGTSTTIATAAELAATGTSRSEIALNKNILDNNAAVGNDTTATYAGNLGVTAAAAGSTNTLQLKAGNTTYSITIGANTTVRDLVNGINGSGIATASVGSDGQLSITGSGSDALSVQAGSTVTATGVFTATAGDNTALFGGTTLTGVSATANSAVRTTLVQQFNDLRGQLNDLAEDASFNGINLLKGDKLSITFNEKTGTAKNKLDINGTDISSSNLGIGTATDGVSGLGNINVQNDTDLAAAADALTGVLTSLRATASSLGSQLSVVETRQNFTKDLVNTLTTGADNLTLADTNEEGAKLLALQTRQQLSQTALSLSNQADQAVLRLF